MRGPNITIRVRFLLTKPASSRLPQQRNGRPYSSMFVHADSQTLSLPDGRILGYSEFGSLEGYPVLFFHGFPSSRLEPAYIDSMAHHQGLRLITPDRPGFGISTPQPNRRIMDWPKDVKALARHLGLSRLAILGGSGGGPYALACALTLPKEMMSAVGVLASAPPWEAGIEKVTRLRKIAHRTSKDWPTAMRGVSDLLIGTARRAAYTRPGRSLINKFLERSNTAPSISSPINEEQKKLSVDQQREQLLRFLFEGFAQGSEAFVHEAKLLTHPWGIRFEDVAYDKVQIWHGSKDVNAPIEMIRHMAKRLPHAELHEFDDSHFSVVRHLEDILKKLVPEQERRLMRDRSCE